MKSYYMKKFRFTMTNQENTEGKNITDFGHKLNELLKNIKEFNLHLPQLEDENKNQISPEDVHQAWRYGKNLNHGQETQFVSILEKILAELDGRI
ncbi:MAG: hypothetical protein V2I97_03330 [Desulfococcaceae bacterium]|nr:hypothetical protein [Desulfococcaceae bacterium]